MRIAVSMTSLMQLESVKVSARLDYYLRHYSIKIALPVGCAMYSVPVVWFPLHNYARKGVSNLWNGLMGMEYQLTKIAKIHIVAVAKL